MYFFFNYQFSEKRAILKKINSFLLRFIKYLIEKDLK